MGCTKLRSTRAANDDDPLARSGMKPCSKRFDNLRTSGQAERTRRFLLLSVAE